MKKTTFICWIIFIATGLQNLSAQEVKGLNIQNPEVKRAQNIFVELGGQGLTFTANYDSRFSNRRDGLGGDILFIEASLSPGKGKLTLTGNLGEVMKESAIIALAYLRAHADLFDIDFALFDQWDVHVHVPAGATPKDGPSAGITMLTALTSAFTQRKVKSNLAMTGEITLRGKVLPVGGIKEKILAAKRANIKDIILCKSNRKDILEIKESYIKDLNFHYVTEMREVINLALTKDKVKNPQKLVVKTAIIAN